jgi:hypothetical protein
MNRTRAAGIVVSAGTLLALLTGPRGPLGGFWRPVRMDSAPAGIELAGLIASGVVEAVAFGAALAVALLGGPLFARLTATPGRATTARLTTAWVLGAWWPHTALHQHVGLNPSALVGIELVFHAGTIVAAGALLWALAWRASPSAMSAGHRRRDGAAV